MEPLSAREDAVANAFMGICEGHGVRRDFEQFDRAAKKALSVLDQEVEPDDLLSALTVFCGEASGTARGAFISRNGEVFLGPRQLRDSHAKTFGLSRTPKTQVRTNELGDLDPASDVEANPLEAIEAVDLVRRIREVVARRRSDADPGSHRHHVLTNFERLQSGELSLRELAEGLHISRSALGEAFAQVRESVVREVGDSREI